MKTGSDRRGVVLEADVGAEMHRLATRLFPICRSLTGNGVRQTLNILGEYIPLQVHEVPTGTQVFDWTVPKEWNIRDAYVLDEAGRKVIDFKENNLHVIGYSLPVDAWVSYEELQGHLHSIPEQPDAIPYITSYYKERWGFCISHTKRLALKKGSYRVYIDSNLEPGSLTYAEWIHPGKTDKEIFLSTYVCHPSMANNELSGPVVATFLANWIRSVPRRYTYRLIFIPETIGSLTYLSRNLDRLKRNVIAGFNLTCLGDGRTYSYVPSRYENTYADKVALGILQSNYPGFTRYTYLDRGSDERQYCSHGIDLPLVTLSCTKFGAYPEYHTSLDDLNFVTPSGLRGGYELIRDCLELIERNEVYQVSCLGEPQLGRRGLYPTLSTKKTAESVRAMMNFIAYADGRNDLIDISNLIGVPVTSLYVIADTLARAGVVNIAPAC